MTLHMHLPWLAVQLSHYLQLDDAVYCVQPCEVPLLVLFRFIVIVVYMATYWNITMHQLVYTQNLIT